MDENNYPKSLDYLRKARLKLSSNNFRFFGLCLYSLRTMFFTNKDPSYNDNLEGYILYNNSENQIFINAEIIENNKDYKVTNLLDIMLHEFNHILRRHDIRRNNRDGETWNIACDHIIDKSLKKLNLTKPYKQYNIIKEIEYNQEYQSEEAVYNWLIQNKNQPNKIQINKDESTGGTNVKDNWQNTNFTMFPDLQSVIENKEITPEQKQTIDSYVSQVRAIYNIEKERGNISNNIQEALEKLLEVHVPWEQLLEKAIKKNAFEKTDRRNWKRPNKFFVNIGIYLPGRVKFTENNGVGTLIIHIDSSGSIDSKDLAKAGYIIYKSINYFNKVIIVVADVEIHQIKEFNKNSKDEMLLFFKNEGFKGRGGTSHRYIFKYFDKYLEDFPDELSLCLSITDMCSDIESCINSYNFHKQVPLIFLNNDGNSRTNINSNNISTILIN